MREQAMHAAMFLAKAHTKGLANRLPYGIACDVLQVVDDADSIDLDSHGLLRVDGCNVAPTIPNVKKNFKLYNVLFLRDLIGIIVSPCLVPPSLHQINSTGVVFLGLLA